MKRLLLIAFLILEFVFLKANDTGYKIPQVLVIQSYHSGFLWTDNVNNGIKTTLKQYDNNIRIRTEFLDTKRFTTLSFKENLKRMLEYKYKDSYFDVIFVADNNAFDIVKDIRKDVFKDTPIVFCGLNFFDESQLGDMTNVTGVREKIVSLENFKLIKKLHKNVEKIIVINEMTPTGKKNKINILSDIRSFKDDIDIEIVEDVSVDELKNRLSNLSPNTVVLYSLFLKDNQGKFLEYDESIRLVTESSVVPVYVSIDFSLGYGAVGGFVSSGTLQGKSAANLAIKILEGAKADKLPVIDISPNNYYFDYQVLEKWGIKLSSLPDNSVIINYEESYFESHKKIIFRFAFILLILAGIIFWLIISVIKKNKLKNDLLNSNESLINLKSNLEVLVKERTNELEDERNFIRTVHDYEDSLVIVFDNLGVIKRTNRSARSNLDFDMDVLSGQSLWPLFEYDSDVTMIESYINNKNQDKKSLSMSLKLISNKGKKIIVDSVISSITTKGNDYYILTGTNVTERYYLFKRLEREEKIYRSVYENSGIAMVTYAKNDFVVMMNNKFEELTGYSREEALNKMTWKDFVDESSVNLIQTNKELRVQKKISPTDTYEIKLVHKKGYVIDVLISVVMVAETNEIISSITDITSKNAIQSKMQLLIEEQKAFNDARNGFYQNLSLDLSSPLNTMNGIFELVEYSHDSTEIETYNKVLRGLTRQLLYMVKEMTNYQSSFTSQQLNIKKYKLAELITDSTTLLLERSNIAKILFTLDEKLTDDLYLAGDSLEKLLQIVIIKLAKNYPDNPITIAVTQEDDDYLKFTIKRSEIGFNDSNYREVTSDKLERIHKLEYISDFRFNFFVVNTLINVLGGKLEIDGSKPNNTEYVFTIQKFNKENVNPNKHHIGSVNRIESLILPNDMKNNKLIAREKIYPLKVLLVNYYNVDHFALYKILEALNQKIDFCLPEQDLKELIVKSTYDVIIFDFSIISINNLNTLKDIRAMKNIYQPFVISIEPYQLDNDIDNYSQLINGRMPEVLNFKEIAELIEQATNFKNQNI